MNLKSSCCERYKTRCHHSSQYRKTFPFLTINSKIMTPQSGLLDRSERNDRCTWTCLEEIIKNDWPVQRCYPWVSHPLQQDSSSILQSGYSLCNKSLFSWFFHLWLFKWKWRTLKKLRSFYSPQLDHLHGVSVILQSRRPITFQFHHPITCPVIFTSVWLADTISYDWSVISLTPDWS